LEPQRYLALGKDHVGARSKPENPVVQPTQRVVYGPWPGFIGGLPLTVAYQACLREHLHVLLERQRLSHRIVQAHGLAGMNLGARLLGVELVELECGNGGRLVLGEVNGLTGERAVSPVAAADVCSCSWDEPAGWRYECIAGLNVGSLQVPPQHDWLG